MSLQFAFTPLEMITDNTQNQNHQNQNDPNNPPSMSTSPTSSAPHSRQSSQYLSDSGSLKFPSYINTNLSTYKPPPHSILSSTEYIDPNTPMWNYATSGMTPTPQSAMGMGIPIHGDWSMGSTNTAGAGAGQFNYPFAPPNSAAQMSAAPNSWGSIPPGLNLSELGVTSPSAPAPGYNPNNQVWMTRPGPIRTMTSPMARQRSSTLNNLHTNTSTPATASPWIQTPYTGYPYPSPSPMRSGRRISIGPTSGQGLMLPPNTPFGISQTQSYNHNGNSPSNGKRLHPAPPESPNIYPQEDDSKKAPRFKPTKAQLDILIAAYEENKNPDGATREALAKQIGGDVRPKTLQIWFQNRRSKSRAKEREASAPRSLSLTTKPIRQGLNVDLVALRGLVHDADPNLVIIPISVLSIGAWTRFLMPGIGNTTPDLACALRLLTSPTLFFYVTHKGETFRLSMPVQASTLSGIQVTENPSKADAVAVQLTLTPNVTSFHVWRDGWVDWIDFTAGAATAGGRCEITGDRDVLLSSFSNISKSLEPSPMTSVPITPFPHGWKFPTVSTTSTAITNKLPAVGPASASAIDSEKAIGVGVGGHHQRQRSLSVPPMSKTQPQAADITMTSDFSTPDAEIQLPEPLTAMFQTGLMPNSHQVSLADSWTYRFPMIEDVNMGEGSATPPFVLEESM